MRLWTVTTASPAETRELGRRLGELLQPPAAVLLEGELGSGKTCLAQGLALGLGVPEEEAVASPTFTLMNHYRGRCDLYHFDLYRLSSPDELLELGFEEYLYGSGVAVVEWAERASGLEVEGVRLRLRPAGETQRVVELRALGKSFETLLARLSGAWEERRQEG